MPAPQKTPPPPDSGGAGTDGASSVIRPALVTAMVSVAAGWFASSLVIGLSGGRDPRVPAHAWLVAHGSGITVGESVIRLVPIGATAVCVALVALVARRYSARGIGDLGTYVGVVAAVYGLIAAVLAALTTTDDITISIPRAAVAGFAVGGIGSALGAGWQHRRAWPISPDLGVVLRGAARGVGAPLIASLLLVLVMLGLHVRRAGELWGMLDPGIGGGVVLAIACILSLPTLVLWAASVLLGPGFSLGTATSVDLTGSVLGAIPGFPTLVAVPPPGRFGSAALLLGLVIPAAGIWAGTVTPRVRLGLSAGALAGLVLGLAIGISGGGIGPGRMVDAGPPPVIPLVVAVPLLAACGALGSVASSWWAAHYGGARDRSGNAGAPRRPGVGHGDESPSAD